MAINPLKQYARIPKIYVKLPTNGKFYPTDMFEYTANGEVGVKAMTATDDLYMSNPDSLLNSDSVYHVLKSCVVGLKDPRKLKVPDVNALMMAIRGASKGDKLKLTTVCPKCGEEHEETLSVRSLLDATATLEASGINPVIEFKKEDFTIRVNTQSSPYNDVTGANIVAFELARLQQYISNNPDMPDVERQNRMSDAFQKMADFQKTVFLNSVESVDLVQMSGEEEVVTKVTDKAHIEEFFLDLESADTQLINENVAKLTNDIGVPNEIPVVCPHCEHEYTMEVKFDPSNFSEDNS